MRYRSLLFGLIIGSLLLAACGLPLAAREPDATPAMPTARPRSAMDACPVTQPPNLPFLPPEPYPPQAPSGEFWYGTDALWTALSPAGRWEALPEGQQGYSQKLFLWSEGYDPAREPQPPITVSGRRLDGDARPFETSGGTNGYHADMGQFMLIGLSVPAAGCWELTARYNEASLSFIVWVAP